MLRAKEHSRYFVYRDAAGVPVSGAAAGLTACVAKDNGAIAVTTNAVSEPYAAVAPGMYRVVLTTSETDADMVTWVVKDVANKIVDFGSEQTERGPFHVFSTPAETSDQNNRAALLNTIADHVLRRSLASVESSTSGDTVGLNSLLGMALVHVNGQEIQCNSTQTECYLPVKTIGGTTLGLITLRTVNGKIVGNCGCT